jgi:hypothetical protein
MNQQAKDVVDSIKPLFEVCLKVADKLGNDQIQIATGRAKDIVKLLQKLEASLPKKDNSPNFMIHYLDKKFAAKC